MNYVQPLVIVTKYTTTCSCMNTLNFINVTLNEDEWDKYNTKQIYLNYYLITSHLALPL